MPEYSARSDDDVIDLGGPTPAVWVMENPLGGWHVSGVAGRFDTESLATIAARTRASTLGAKVFVWRVREGARKSVDVSPAVEDSPSTAVAE